MVNAEPAASSVAAIAADDLQVLHRRTLNALRLAQVPGQAAVASSVAVVTLLASDLLGSDRLAGLASAAFTLGAAITSIPLSAHMRRHGRRPGLVAALLVGSLGSAVAGAGGQVRVFPLFVFGMLLFGAGQSATLQSRYVGADLAAPDQRAKSIAAIVWVGTLGAVFGPIFTPFEKDFARVVGLDELVGPYVFGTTLFLVSAAVMFTCLRPDPLVVLGATNPHAERPRPLRQVQASYGVIRRSPGAVLGLASMAGAQAAMVAVMAMTPAHMKDHGHADLSAFVIAAHILGMFGLAPVVGRFVDRVGTAPAIACGAVVLASGTVSTVAAGYVPVLMFVGLFLLGLGWSVCLIAGTTLLTGSVPAESRVEAQGTGDLTLSLCGAVAAFGSGFVKQSLGFHLLAHAATVIMAALLAATWLSIARRVQLQSP
ncbi:MAG TPA: MFS transporter [Ilumatobacteraceae bacterium]|nr:MFS transporter [Ilumatobacteraceae bacterium]